MPTIKNLIIFGDSMSDIGNKRVTAMGAFARLFSLMRVNDVGRYSDGKNWTDFLWEWATGGRLIEVDKDTSNANTLVHRSLTAHSAAGSDALSSPLYYANYAEGGAMGASDRAGTGLGYYKDQVLRYIEERNAFALPGNTLHIIWFGLNDLITNGRDPDKMDYVVDEIGTGMRSINMQFGHATEYFMVLNMPDPAGAVRLFMENDIKKVAGYQRGVAVFNRHLEGLLDGTYYDHGDKVTLVDMYSLLNKVNDNLEEYGLVGAPQEHGVPVNYDRLGDGHPQRSKVTTSDLAHPTEKVYCILATEVSEQLTSKLTLGNLKGPG